MEVRQTVRRFPAVALALILLLAAALAVVMTLSIGGWGLTIPGASTASSTAQPADQSAGQSHPGSPATETRPTMLAPDTTQPAGRPASPRARRARGARGAALLPDSPAVAPNRSRLMTTGIRAHEVVAVDVESVFPLAEAALPHEIRE